jgi:hypothetical protein
VDSRAAVQRAGAGRWLRLLAWAWLLAWWLPTLLGLGRGDLGAVELVLGIPVLLAIGTAPLLALGAWRGRRELDAGSAGAP